MSEVKTLTLRDVSGKSEAEVSELLDPFVSGDNDEDKARSREQLSQAVREHVRYLDSVDRDTRAEKLDSPILSAAPSEKKASSSSSSSKGSSSSSRSRSRKRK